MASPSLRDYRRNGTVAVCLRPQQLDWTFCAMSHNVTEDIWDCRYASSQTRPTMALPPEVSRYTLCGMTRPDLHLRRWPWVEGVPYVQTKERLEVEP